MGIVVRLDRVMADRKVRGKDLAEQVGVGQVMLSRIKRGHVREVRLATLAALRDALSCGPGGILELAPEGAQDGTGAGDGSCAGR